MFLSFFLDGWSDRAERWVNARFWRCWQRADGPTRVTDLPNASRTYRGNKTSVPNARGRTVNLLSSDEFVFEEKRLVMAESSLPFRLTFEQHHVNVILPLGCVRSHEYKREQFWLWSFASQEPRLDRSWCSVWMCSSFDIGANHVYFTHARSRLACDSLRSKNARGWSQSKTTATENPNY